MTDPVEPVYPWSIVTPSTLTVPEGIVGVIFGAFTATLTAAGWAGRVTAREFMAATLTAAGWAGRVTGRPGWVSTLIATTDSGRVEGG